MIYSDNLFYISHYLTVLIGSSIIKVNLTIYDIDSCVVMTSYNICTFIYLATTKARFIKIDAITSGWSRPST